jgi:hypothetical protein
MKFLEVKSELEWGLKELKLSSVISAPISLITLEWLMNKKLKGVALIFLENVGFAFMLRKVDAHPKTKKSQLFGKQDAMDRLYLSFN